MFRLSVGMVVGAVLAGVVFANELQNPVPSTAKSIETGRQLFQKYCKGCHGENVAGNGPLAPKDVHPPNLTDAEWKYGAADGEIFTNIHDGIGPKFNMKSMKGRMTDAEIWSSRACTARLPRRRGSRWARTDLRPRRFRSTDASKACRSRPSSCSRKDGSTPIRGWRRWATAGGTFPRRRAL